jgi:S1-C subfamily serine protease
VTTQFKLTIIAQIHLVLLLGTLNAQDFLDELPTSRRLNGKQTTKAFGDAGVNAKRSTITIISNDKALALATIIDSNGYCITKASELEGNTKFLGIGPHSEKISVNLLGSDKNTDLALLKIAPVVGKPVKWQKSENYSQGSWVCAMNHQSNALMIGVVSAKSRNIKGRSGVLGVLLDPKDDPEKIGVAIVEFGPNSPAQKEGIIKGDLVIRVEEKEIMSRKDLSEEVKKFAPMDEVNLKILRGEEGIPFSIRLNYMSNVFDMLDRNQKMSGLTSKRKAGFSNVIQHEIPLQPVDMGAPLLNLEGLAIGINIARSDRVTTYALPYKLVKESITKIQANLK